MDEEDEKETRGERVRNENGRIEFPICDMRLRAVRKGRETHSRLYDGTVRRSDDHGEWVSAGCWLGYHFSAVLPRKHVPGINELTISE